MDIIAGGAIMDYDRSVASDLTYPFEFEFTGMLIQSPNEYEDKRFLIVMEPFSLAVLSAFLICLFSITRIIVNKPR